MTETQPPPTTQSRPPSAPPGTTEQWRRWYGAYRAWFADQSARELAITMLLGVLLAGLLLLALRVVTWIVTGLIDWLFIDDTPPPPPPPEPASDPSPFGIALESTVQHVVQLVQHWSSTHAFGDVDPALVPLAWLIIGAVLLLFSQSIIGVPLFVGWSALSVWVVYDATGTGNPVPAALTAGVLGLVWVGWWYLAATARKFAA